MNSATWKYFEKKTKDSVQCKLCFKTLRSSGNTSNMMKHLRSCHQNIVMSDDSGPSSRKRQKSLNETVNSEEVLLVSEEPDDTEPHASTSAGTSTLKQCKLMFIKDKEKVGPSSARDGEENLHEEAGPSSVKDDKNNLQSLANKSVSNPISRMFQLKASYKEGGPRHAAITNAILYYICADLKPFHTVKNRGFVKLMKTLAPNYIVPSDTHVKHLISEKYNAMKNALKERLRLQNDFCATCDIWTDTMNMTSFLGITLHYLDGLVLKSSYVATIELQERHTAEYIANVLSQVFKEWGIDKNNIVAILTDNGANMVAAVRFFFDNSLKKHIPCFAHTINLIADKVLTDGETVSFVEKVRNIVKYFKRSVVATDNLKKSQLLQNKEPKKLILDVSTRWNSCYYMCERFLELAPIISPILLNDSHAPVMLTAMDITSLKELVLLLQPLEYITRELSGEQYVTLSKVIPLINCLISQVNNMVEYTSPVFTKAKELLQTQLQNRFGGIEHMPIVAVSMLLDPRFKNLHFKNPEACASAMSILRRTIAAYPQDASSGSDTDTVPDIDSQNFWRTHKELACKSRKKPGTGDELSHYIKSPVTPLKSNPIETWEDMKEVFPSLYKEFRRYAVVVATSVPAERLFSKAGAIMATTRNRLKPKRLNELLFLYGRPEEEWF